LFNAVTVAGVAILGRSGFWNGRGARPTGGRRDIVCRDTVDDSIGGAAIRHGIALRSRGMPRLAQKHRFST
jgi:hypothetical protein